jgi:hypothetical protein
MRLEFQLFHVLIILNVLLPEMLKTSKRACPLEMARSYSTRP